nr:hypothetical protein [uncultured Cohaesibacter sp.]
MSLSPDEFSDERLKRRQQFLTDRAEAHLGDISYGAEMEKEKLLKACAATLYRDAACVAFLREEVCKARTLLHKAGSLFLSLGLPIGESFIALAWTEDAENELSRYADVRARIREQWRLDRARAREGAHQARSEPPQLLAMMQADWIIIDRRQDLVQEVEGGPLREALERNSGYPVGATGLSIGSYVGAAEWFAKRSGVSSADGHPPERIVASISTLMAIRDEHLRAARKDLFHWRMLARPAELVDLDAIILMYLAINEGGTPKMGLETMIGWRLVETSLLNAPIQIAKSLKCDPNR